MIYFFYSGYERAETLNASLIHLLSKAVIILNDFKQVTINFYVDFWKRYFRHDLQL